MIAPPGVRMTNLLFKMLRRVFKRHCNLPAIALIRRSLCEAAIRSGEAGGAKRSNMSLRAERSNLIQNIMIRCGGLDCFVVKLLAMTDNRNPFL